MKIDTHVHFWKYKLEDFTWVKDAKIQKDFLPDYLEHFLKSAGYEGCINVQARFKYEENDFMLESARRYDFIKGVIGWVSLTDSRLDDRMEELAKYPKLVGVRDFTGDCIGADGKIRNEYFEGLKTIEKHNKVFELVINEDQLEDSIILAEELPGLTFIIDHMAKPKIQDGIIEPWASNIKRISRYNNVYCKVSGIATEADPANWKEDDLAPYLDVVFDAFGTDRLMTGSDWPVCLSAGDYGRVMGVFENYMRRCSGKEKAAVLGGNALAIYGIQ